MLLEAQELSFGYGSGPDIVSGVSLRLESGQRLGLSADSGLGKTTLCQLLSGHQKPRSGRVLLDGKPLQDWGAYCPVQLLWQHPEQAVNPRLAMKYVLEEGDQIAERVICGLGIRREWMSRYPAELSGGELQRFCIARALGERTRFLLADEMTAMLDLVTQNQIWSFLLEETQRRQIGLLVVSHSQPLLQKLCGDIVSLCGKPVFAAAGEGDKTGESTENGESGKTAPKPEIQK